LDVDSDHRCSALHRLKIIFENVKIDFDHCHRSGGDGSVLDVAAWHAALEVSLWKPSVDRWNKLLVKKNGLC